MEEQGYKKLEVYQLAHKLAVEVHGMSMQLPKHEMYEQGSQIRRSSKSVSAQIVEGYALRKNKNEFLQYLNRAFASATETVEHLDLLHETKSLNDDQVYRDFHDRYDSLCRMLFRFIQSVSEEHSKPRYLKEGASYEI
jgi:four helix bundle protein